MVLRAPLQGTSDAEFRRWVQRWWPEVSKISPLGFGLPYLFGDASDGDVDFTTASFASGTIKQYRNFSIASGQTLSCSSASEGLLVIYCSERCLVAGTISLNGVGGAGAIAGVPVNGVGATATSYTTSYGASGGGGGGGGAIGGVGGATVVAGGTAGVAAGTPGGAGNTVGLAVITGLRMRQDKRDFTIVSWGTGGGGGGANVGTAGAGSNGGGGVLLIARELTITGTISANGTNGVAASGGVSEGGGGGGGGGFIYLISQNLIETGTVTATGGSGGAGTGTGTTGGSGGAGTIVRERIPV